MGIKLDQHTMEPDKANNLRFFIWTYSFIIMVANQIVVYPGKITTMDVISKTVFAKTHALPCHPGLCQKASVLCVCQESVPSQLSHLL